ncbi:TonB-dependent receptor plug domain-containing protein [Pseudoxanthomonas sp. 10H]|uniref:TonB-dependent receptor plug domain-containing protein n=1 Tax=Pseudoxanthomonas sp. 10H TaxID=3242729 RepID=UPI0035583FD8
MAAPAVASAQSGEAQATQTLDKIEVLGSRIKRAGIETAQPVLSLTREDLDRTGLTQVSDVLRELTVAGPSLSLNTNNGNTSGNSSISLRNCGSNRTLVLVNGRRWASDNGLGGAVDLNSIPMAAVENIQVLRDGASALYGSDAICGVVNIQTRRDFDGAQFNAYYGQYDAGDGGREAYDFTLGGSTDRFSGLINLAFTEQEAVSAGDREISAVPLYGFPATVSTPGRASPTGPYGNFTVTGRGNIILDPSRPGCLPNQRCTTATAADFRPFNFLTDGYNFAPDNHLVQPQRTYSLFGTASYELTDDVRFSTEVFYNNRVGDAQLAAQPLSPLTISAQSIYNPFGVNITGGAFRPTNFPRVFGQEQDTWRFSGAFDGIFEIGDRIFDWDAGYTYASNKQLQPKNGFYFSTRVAQATGPSFIDAGGVARCGTPTAIIADCVPMNVMGGPAGFTQEMYDYIAVNPKNLMKSTSESFVANLSGDLFSLPAGTAGFAFGLEHRKESGSSEPDPLTAAGLVLGDNPFLPTEGSYSVDEAYLELQVPILADAAFAKALELNLAARYSDYSSFGTTTNPQVSLRWQVSDTLLVRGSWGEGFRAPSVTELYQGFATGRPSFQDVCSNNNPNFVGSAAVRSQCQANGVPVGFRSQLSQTYATTGGNPDLKPETSETKTVGLVYSPDWAEGLETYVDWYHIVIENAIGALTAQTIINECYLQANAGSCALITRDQVGAVNGNPGEISGIQAVNRNFVGGLQTEGFDFGASYHFEPGDWGRFHFRLDNTYVSYYGDVDEPARGQLNGDGRISSGNTVGTLPSGSSTGAPRHRLRSNLTAAWSMGAVDASITFEYRSRVQESCNNVYNTAIALGARDPAYLDLVNLCSDPNRIIDDYQFVPGTTDVVAVPSRRPENELKAVTYTHVQAGWSAPWDGKVTLGIRNLFDTDPPFSSDAFANSYDAQYLVPGRFFYMSYQQRF